MTSKLINVGKRTRSVFKTIDGRQFYGQILNIPDTARVSNFLSTRRYLRTSPGCFIIPTDVVVIGGLNYICGEHGEGFYVDPIYKQFKMFEVDTVLEWFPKQRNENPVTGVNELSNSVSAGNAYLSSQQKNDMVDNIHIGQEQRTVVCNKPVQPDDLLGDFVCTQSDHLLGVYILVIRRR